MARTQERVYTLGASQPAGKLSGASAERPEILGIVILSADPLCPGPHDIAVCFREGDEDKFDPAAAKWTAVQTVRGVWGPTKYCHGSITHERLGPDPVWLKITYQSIGCGGATYEHAPKVKVDRASIVVPPEWINHVFKVGDDLAVFRVNELTGVQHWYYNGSLLCPDPVTSDGYGPWVQEWRLIIGQRGSFDEAVTYERGAYRCLTVDSYLDPSTWVVYFGDDLGLPVQAELQDPAGLEVVAEVGDTGKRVRVVPTQA